MSTLSEAQSIRILIIEDHQMVREAMQLMLSFEPDFEVVCGLDNGEDAIQLLKTKTVDLVILDLCLGNKNSLQYINQILALQPHLHILLITGSSEPILLKQAQNSGAHGLVFKHENSNHLRTGLRAIHRGELYFCPTLSSISKPSSMAEITQREEEILHLIASGQGYADIAKQLNISPGTVRKHRENLMRKLNLHNTAEITAYAIHLKQAN